MRRSKHSHFRRQRVPVEITSEESAAEVTDDDAHDAEKIEVHVHVHRDEARKRSRVTRPPPALRGKLFDWQWYDDQLSKRPRPTGPARAWSRAATCEACDSMIPSKATHCPRCAAPRSRRRLLPIVMAMMGFGCFAVVLAIGAHVLGGSVPEAQAPAPVGKWSDDDYVIVEVPAPAPSPFSGASTASNSGTSGGGVATR
jgi:hypothetical protein